jgi:hypothetical protein
LLVIALVAPFALIKNLSDRLDQAEADMARVEASSALFAGQVTGIQTQLVELEPQVSDGIGQAILALNEFAESTLEFKVWSDETVQTDTEFVIDRTIEVPISESIPIATSVPVKADLPITVNVADTELADLARSLADGLSQFRSGIDGFVLG